MVLSWQMDQTYRGDYGGTRPNIWKCSIFLALHSAKENPDVLTCETVPCSEAIAIARALCDPHDKRHSRMVLSCKDEHHISSGRPSLNALK